MSNPNPNEIWQVEVGGQVYEAPFGELPTWIDEGSLLPTDKVRKGNLRWIEARRVPTLTPFFDAKAKGLPLPVVKAAESVTGPVADAAAPPPSVTEPEPASTFVSDPSPPASFSPSSSGVPDPEVCFQHPGIESAYLCDGCGHGFCKTCPKAYGGTVRVCPLCGALCRAKTTVRQNEARSARKAAAITEGFGVSDFFNALAHPFKFKTSLFFGAILFMAFSLGQSAAGMGGIYMMASALFCLLLANMLTFGVLANTINNFASGNLEANFMPSFDDFELWDDVVHPFFLSIGAYVASFGPFILVMIIGLYLILSSVSSQMQSFQQDVERIPGTKYYDAQRTVDQSQEVKKVVGEVSNRQAQFKEELEREYEEAMNPTIGNSNTANSSNTESVSDRETREQEELWAMAQESRKQGLESVLGKSPETQEKESEAMMQNFLSLAPPLVVLGAIFFIWGIFYFPVACAIAGYTRSFSATINPVVGLDTIKRLGGAYIGILVMGFLLILASMIVSGIAAVVLSAFNMPGFGNLPAKAIGALFGFFVWVVFSCILGYAMYKKSDRLALD